jgi:hypothetical protein
MMMGCKKCQTVCGVGLLVLGVLFLLKDLGTWGFWGINWWTALLIWVGFGTFMRTRCDECQAIITGRRK